MSCHVIQRLSAVEHGRVSEMLYHCITLPFNCLSNPLAICQLHLLSVLCLTNFLETEKSNICSSIPYSISPFSLILLECGDCQS
jgi:hypothetical protein